MSPPGKIELTEQGRENFAFGDPPELPPLRHRLGPAPGGQAEELSDEEWSGFDLDAFDELEMIIEEQEQQEALLAMQGSLARPAIVPVLGVLGFDCDTDAWFDSFATAASELGTNAARHTISGITLIGLYKAISRTEQGLTRESLVLAIGDAGVNNENRGRIPIGYTTDPDNNEKTRNGRHGRGLRIVEDCFGKENCGYTYVEDYPDVLDPFCLAKLGLDRVTRTIVWAQAPLIPEEMESLEQHMKDGGIAVAAYAED